SSHDSIPVYERFRLGGTTLDGLRGYEDYQVVPRANEHFVAAFRKDANGNFVPIADDSSGRIYLPVPEGTPSAPGRPIHKAFYPGGRVMGIFSLEQQFPIVNPVHGLVFFEA